MADIAMLDDNNFEEVTKSGVTLVDFFAEWCGPCRTIAPVLEGVAKELSGQVQFGKLDIDKSHVTAKAHHVTSVPTLILYKDGEEVNRLVGLRDAAAIKDFATSTK
ncbi:MAG: thioredoxin [Chlamydiales bacterium]|nr:thioredoxin [Chlamydiia bacterium]MCP5503859.1 thioredoxin [Chlamydiales bacterium]